jgi:signal transduction histidine kinase
LNNVAKHSGAKQVHFSLTKHEGAIRLLIQDNGKGFEWKSILAHPHTTNLGLASMRERAELTGGNLSIESTPGKGTSILGFWPMEAKP